jgi:hypothetical protein
VQIEDQEGHGHREDAIAQGREPLEVASLDPVVESGHGSFSLDEKEKPKNPM